VLPFRCKALFEVRMYAISPSQTLHAPLHAQPIQKSCVLSTCIIVGVLRNLGFTTRAFVGPFRSDL